MYEQFKNQYTLEISNLNIPEEQTRLLLAALDKVAYNYTIAKKDTEIALYNQDVPQLVKTYIVSKSIEGYAKGTLYNYQKILVTFFRYVQKIPETVTANDIRVFLYKYQEENNISNCTLDKYRAYIRSFYSWAVSEGYLDKNPSEAIKPIRFDVKPRVPLEQIDLEYFRMACNTDRERAIVEFLYSTGCRVSEMANVKIDDIDWKAGTVTLYGKGRKYRISYLNAKAIVALRQYLSSRTDNNPHLFVSTKEPHCAIKKATFEQIIRKLSARVGERVNKHVTPHVFRHTTATTALKNGMSVDEISRLLGHAALSTTMIYAHSSTEAVHSAHQKAVI